VLVLKFRVEDKGAERLERNPNAPRVAGVHVAQHHVDRLHYVLWVCVVKDGRCGRVCDVIFAHSCMCVGLIQNVKRTVSSP
jgi:hypothetical protein